jgi:hypothetical protein
MIRLVLLLVGALRALLRRRSDLVLENLALRQQVAVLAARGGRPRITIFDRWLWTTLRRCWSRWADVLVFVKPDAVVRWHRAAFVAMDLAVATRPVVVDRGPARASAR